MYNFHGETPIYLQLMEVIKGQIAAGKYKPGEKISSIRELAAFYTVNPNTVQRALMELEREGLLYTRRASGKLVTEDEALIHKLRTNLATARLETCLAAMEVLGYTPDEMVQLFEQRAALRRKQGGENQEGAQAPTGEAL
ncbi:MAG: GntR family transcriptional regulator [Treponema sp.]|nr:GntR family transcriptional regulator [Treponema sp.]